MGHRPWVRVALVGLFGVACFAAGAWLVRPPPPSQLPAGGPDVAPVVVVDAGAIELLPDASLELKLPSAPVVPAKD